MKFGALPLDQALGAILAHGVSLPQGRLKKGTIIDAQMIEALRAAGMSQVIAARLEAQDYSENEAAARLAQSLGGGADGLIIDQAQTGRVNIRAKGNGLARVGVGAINALNAVDPAITLATLPDLARVRGGQIIATVKIIPYGVARDLLDLAAELGQGALGHHAPVLRRAHLILTGARDALTEKSIAAIETRLRRLDAALTGVTHCAHETGALAQAIMAAQADLILVLTQSATSDIADVMPAALVAAGGQVTRFGMPVDPGNLLVLGQLREVPVIGLPGCARSPALNGADWVMERVICGLTPSGAQIAAMGVGGLLKEIPIRPAPRQPKGQSRR